MRDRRHLLVVPIAALLAVLPLVLKGASCGHDFQFHTLSWLEAGSQWRQGVPFPHWEFTTAWNSGEPRFTFYPPLSWVTGAMLGLVLPWPAVANTFIWLALTACGFTMYRLAREWTGQGNALIAACFYMVHPYMLFTFYERAAYGELLAAAWLPLLMLALLRSRPSIAGIALPVALLWLTNDPAAVIGCYVIAVLGAMRVVWRMCGPDRIHGALGEAVTLIAGTALGMALAGFYLVPAIYEQRWVRIRVALVEGVRVQDNFLFGHFGAASHQAILRTASLCSVALLVLIAALAAIALLRPVPAGKSAFARQAKHLVTALLLLAAFIAFMLTWPSALLWRHAPELNYLQFPWRFDAVLGCVGALLLALALNRVTPNLPAATGIALAIPLLLSMSGDRLFRQSCDRGNDVTSLANDFYQGNVYDAADQYTPAGSDPLAVGHANPAKWIASTPDAPAPAGSRRDYSVALADRLHFNVSSAAPAFLIVSLRDYPAWTARLNGVPVVARPHRPDGLIVLPIPAGESKIDIRYTLTWDRIAGWALTGLASCALVAFRRRPEGPPSRRATPKKYHPVQLPPSIPQRP